MDIQDVKILRELRIRKSRKNFWEFCKTMNPAFYLDDRTHLKTLCDTLQSLYEGKLLRPDGTPYKKLQINMPPGFGKSYTASLFSMWVFGINIENELISVSYNEKLSERSARSVRDGIEEVKHPLEISYRDIFPKTKIKTGDASKSNWSIEGRYHSYLATSFNATITGMRGNIGVIDDPVKDFYTACNEQVLEDQWDWYKNTFLSRMVEGAIQIVIQTRWATKDLCGRLLEAQPNSWYVLSMEAMVDDVMLCPALMSRETYEEKKSLTSPEIFQANYHQKPVDAKGKLYKSFKTYTSLPESSKIISYVDIAGKGKDALVSFVGAIKDGELYIIDALFSKEGTEITEDLLADLLFKNVPQICRMESNNGGDIFARNLRKKLFEKYKTRMTKIEDVHQSRNKEAKILTVAGFVMEHVYFPEGWDHIYPEIYTELNSHQRDNRANSHDDCADALSELSLMVEEATKFSGVIRLGGI